MALSITVLGRDMTGHRRRTYGTLAFDSSYPAGGEAWAAGSFEMYTVDRLDIENTNGYAFAVDYTNKKIKVFASQPYGIVNTNTTAAVSTGTTSNQTLMSYTLPGGTLAADGESVKVTAWGITAGNTNTKQLLLKWGAVDIFDGGADAANNQDWYVEAIITRSGAAAQTIVTNGSSSATFVPPNVTADTATLSSDVTIAMTVTQGTASATDVTQNGMIVELLAPAGSAGGAGIEVTNAASLASLTGVRWEAIGV